MTTRKKVILWLGLVLSVPLSFYAALCAFLWTGLAEPNSEGWYDKELELWSEIAVVLAVLFLGLFVFCLVSIIKGAKKKAM